MDANIVAMVISLQQVVVTLAIAYFGSGIVLKLREVPRLKAELESYRRQLRALFRFSDTVTAHMRSVEGEFLWQADRLRSAWDGIDQLKGRRNEVAVSSSLNMRRYLVALFGEEFASVETALKMLSQIGDQNVYLEAIAIIEVRESLAGDFGWSDSEKERIELCLTYWRRRLAEGGAMIIHSKRWTGMGI